MNNKFWKSVARLALGGCLLSSYWGIEGCEGGSIPVPPTLSHALRDLRDLGDALPDLRAVGISLTEQDLARLLGDEMFLPEKTE